MNNWRDVFPSTADEVAAMVCCYAALPTLLLMIRFHREFAGAVIGLVDSVARLLGA